MVRVWSRVWLAGLLVLGLVVSLLGVAPPEGAMGAHGDEEDIDFAPIYSACVGAATMSAGFEDTEGIGAEDAINCLFHYGITTGRSETMYAPTETVLRWQMALFMARAAAAAGIVIANPAEDQGFTDIGMVSEEAQNAINGLAAAGIMAGTSQTTFMPNSSVNRGSMAMILDAFLREATPGTGAFGGETSSYADVKTDNTAVFTDVNTVSLNTYNAIFRIYELGVTKGVAEHQFQPAGLVTRGQMAAFITRAFSHTIARPAGVSVQGDMDMIRGPGNVDLIVSVRDTNFQPVQNATVDVFQAPDADAAFDDDGVCDSTNVSQVGGIGQSACEVDLGDSATDQTGDLTDLSLTIEDAGVTVWAWTGDRADKFDSDDTAFSTFAVSFAKAADRTLVSDTLTEGQDKSKFGETVTVTIQIADEDGVAVPEKGKTVSVTQANYEGAIGAMTQPTTSSSNSMTTDADGKIVLEFTQADPNTNTGDVVTVRLTLGVPATGGLALKDEDGEPFTTKDYVWSDEAAVPTNLTLEGRNDFVIASEERDGAQNTVVATLTDQFGDPVRGKTINFLSDTYCRDDDDPCAVTGIGVDELGGVATEEDDGKRVLSGTPRERLARSSGRDGTASRFYYYDSDNSVIETIWATYTLAASEVQVQGVADATDPRPENDPDDVTVLTTDRLYQYWVEDAASGDAPFTGRILMKDPDNDRLVVAAKEKLLLVKYDSNDQFSDLDGPTVMAEFEKPLEENADPAAVHLKVTRYAEEASEVSTFFLQEEWPTLQHPDGERAGAGARFGNAVAADNGVIVVGAWYETVAEQMGSCLDSQSDCSETDDVDQTKAGMVYIFPSGVDTAKDNVVRIRPPDGDVMEDGYFGWDVDISGGTVVVGTRDTVLGKSYVYERSGGTWSTTPAAILSESAGTYNRGFGEGVAVSGDEQTIAVVAPASASNGAVVVYEKGSAWTTDSDTTNNARLKDGSSSEGNAWNGERSIAISEDGSVILSGACGYDDDVPSNANCAGLVNLFERPSASWGMAEISDATVTFQSNFGQTVLERFGKYVAISADGSAFVASGHWRADAGRPGVMFVYTEPDHADGWGSLDTNPATTATSIQGAVLSMSRGRASDVFGQYVAMKSDGSEVAAGRHYRQEGDFRGSVATFSRPANGWTNDSSPDDEFLGPWVNAHLGWATTYDKTTGDLYTGIRDEVTIEDPPPSHKLLTVYQITR